MKLIAVAIAALVGGAGSAVAAEPQFGRWAVDARHCSGDTKAGPLTVTATSATLASEYCTFGKMYKAARALYIEGRCSNGMRHPITLAMMGDRLAVTWNGERTEMKRCP
ncbi:MAG: hypothetical protein E6G97_15080 [Alphaproteobacteria bacterium]|nr:MAG: hypothetical protein E6G97_15080 [Alphaproteobacteria bacterium]